MHASPLQVDAGYGRESVQELACSRSILRQPSPTEIVMTRMIPIHPGEYLAELGACRCVLVPSECPPSSPNEESQACGIDVVGATHGSPAFCPRFVLATKDVVGATSAGARNSGHPGPRPSGARYARVHLRSCSDVANLGQNIQPEAAKRTVVQTATLDTGDIFMTINNFQANESVLVQYPG